MLPRELAARSLPDRLYALWLLDGREVADGLEEDEGREALLAFPLEGRFDVPALGRDALAPPRLDVPALGRDAALPDRFVAPVLARFPLYPRAC